MILFDGYYMLKGEIEEEWHAGIHMRHRVFSSFLFYKDGGILIASKKTNIDNNSFFFEKSEFKKSKSLDFYKIVERELVVYRLDNTLYQSLMIESPKMLVDEYKRKYTYLAFR